MQTRRCQEVAVNGYSTAHFSSLLSALKQHCYRPCYCGAPDHPKCSVSTPPRATIPSTYSRCNVIRKHPAAAKVIIEHHSVATLVAKLSYVMPGL